MADAPASPKAPAKAGQEPAATKAAPAQASTTPTVAADALPGVTPTAAAKADAGPPAESISDEIRKKIKTSALERARNRVGGVLFAIADTTVNTVKKMWNNFITAPASISLREAIGILATGAVRPLKPLVKFIGKRLKIGKPHPPQLKSGRVQEAAKGQGPNKEAAKGPKQKTADGQEPQVRQARPQQTAHKSKLSQLAGLRKTFHTAGAPPSRQPTSSPAPAAPGRTAPTTRARTAAASKGNALA